MHTTEQVAAQLGISVDTLNSWINRHEKYKPAGRDKLRFVWTDEEVEALKQARAVSTSRNRHKAGMRKRENAQN